MLTRWSSVIGLVAFLCVMPSAVETFGRYRDHGTVSCRAINRLMAVPLLYVITRYAERKMA
jgi:hypothetical protein